MGRSSDAKELATELGISAVCLETKHMTRGQRAMAVARIYPEAQKGKHTSVRNTEVSSGCGLTHSNFYGA